MTNTIDKLGEILLKHRTDTIAIYHGISNGLDIETSASEAEQAIIAWALEAVGSDEPIGEQNDFATGLGIGANQVRAEIRAKFTGEKL